MNVKSAAAYRITNGAGFAADMEWAETKPGTALASGVSTMVTSAPIPTTLYNCMMSLERILMQP